MSQQQRQRQAHVHVAGRRRRITVYALLAAVLVIAGWFAARPFLRGTQTGGTLVVVQATMGGFRPDTIRARVGDTLRIRLESLDTQFHLDGGGRHQFAIDQLGVDIVAPPLGSTDVSFVVREPGVYEFYCSICCGGKANPTMWGRLIVES